MAAVAWSLINGVLNADRVPSFPLPEVPWGQLIKQAGTVSAVIYGLPRSFCLESWAAALFMAGSRKSAPRAGFTSALEDGD